MSDPTAKREVPEELKEFTFPKGTSGNPNGRPRGLERLVRETVGDDMPAIIKAQVAIAKGKKPDGMEHLPSIKPSDVTKAAEWLADRGWGKARQHVTIDGDIGVGPIDFTKLTDEQLDEMIAKGAADDPPSGTG